MLLYYIVCLILQEINITAINSGFPTDDDIDHNIIMNYQKHEVEFKSTGEQAEKIVAHMQRTTKAFVKRVTSTS